MAGSLALVTVAVYWPALHNGFIWDDDAHLTNNPHLRDLAGLVSIWTSSAARICPLVQTGFWLQFALWGLVPWPYHLMNILLHAASVLVLWRVLLALDVRGAWLGAALWALHPVAVESVAWITEMKNTQSALFYLLCVWFYVKWRQAALMAPPRAAWAAEKLYALALLCGGLAMASKSSTVVLPLVLGLCSWWVEGGWSWRAAMQLGPFLLCSGLASAVSLWTQRLEGAVGAQYARSGPERLVTAGKVVWFYLGKLIWPDPLVFIYPRWAIHASQAASYWPLAAVAGTSLVLWWKRRGWGRPGFFAWGYFLIALLPVLGLVDHYFLRYSFVGDHFQYLASIGPLALAGAALSAGLDLAAKRTWLMKAGFCGMLLIVLGGLTFGRTHVFRDNEALWRDTLAKNPACWMAHNNLGTALEDKGQMDEAISQFREATRLNPDFAEAYINLGTALDREGQADEAMRQFQTALRLKPNHADTHCNLGVVLSKKGQTDEAIREYQEALRLKPDDADTHNNLGLAFRNKGQTDEAIRQFEEAIRLRPDHAEAHYNLGNALHQKNQIDEAIRQLGEAVRLKPDYVDAHINLGGALLSKGQFAEAIRHWKEVVRLKPDDAAAHNNLGGVFNQQGRTDEAIQQFQEALRLEPGQAEAHNNLGDALARRGQIDEAIAQFQEALRLKPDFALARNNLNVLLTYKTHQSQPPAAPTSR